MSFGRTIRGVLFALAIASAPELPAQTARDSAGIHILSVDLTRPMTLVSLSPSAIVDIGGSAVEREQLFRVRAIARLSDGTVAIANGGSNSVKVFDRSGAFVREFGRKGQGPAEFVSVSGMWVLPGDTILVTDDRARRLVFFTRDGHHLRTVTMVTPPDRREPRVIDVIEGRAALAVSSDVTRMPPRREPYYFTQQLFVYGLDGKPVRSVGNFGEAEFFVQTVPPEMGGAAYWSRTFGRTMTIRALGPDVLVGDGTTFELRRVSQTGTPIAIIRAASHVAPAVTSADRASERVTALEGVKPEDRPVEERRLAEMPYPERFPAFARFEIDPVQRIWVMEYRRPGVTSEVWRVIAANGTYLGDVSIPVGGRLRAIGRDWVACVVRDSDDVEHVRVYSLTIRETAR